MLPAARGTDPFLCKQHGAPGVKKEHGGGESHLVAGSNQSRKVMGNDSLVVMADRHERVLGRQALEVS